MIFEGKARRRGFRVGEGRARARPLVPLATISAAHRTELVERLKGLGATLADVGQGDVPWTVMADPNTSDYRF